MKDLFVSFFLLCDLMMFLDSNVVVSVAASRLHGNLLLLLDMN